MATLDNLFLSIGSIFTPDIYFVITQIQGILWSIANSAIVFFFLRINGLIRMKQHRKTITCPYYLLLITILLSIFLLTTKSGAVFFALEAAIYGIQYSILLYILFFERKALLRYFRNIVINTGKH